MKKIIVLLALLLMTNQVYSAVSDISNSPAVYVNDKPFDKSLIMKASSSATSPQGTTNKSNLQSARAGTSSTDSGV